MFVCNISQQIIECSKFFVILVYLPIYLVKGLVISCKSAKLKNRLMADVVLDIKLIGLCFSLSLTSLTSVIQRFDG